MADLKIVNLSGQYPYLQKGTLSSAPQGLVVHHTATPDNATPQSIAQSWKTTGTSAQYIMGRDGTIYQMMPDGGKAYQIKSSWNPSIPWASNSTTQGIELIAKNDKDVTPAQVAALQQFALKQAQTYGYDPATHVVGHGEVNGSAGLNGKTRADGRPDNEGMTAVAALRTSLNGKGLNPLPPMNVPAVASAFADTSVPPLPKPDPRTALGQATQMATNEMGAPAAGWQDFYKGVGEPALPSFTSQADANRFYADVGRPSLPQTQVADAGLSLGMSPVTGPAALALGSSNANYPVSPDAGYNLSTLTPNSGAMSAMTINSSGSPDDRDQSLSAILAQASGSGFGAVSGGGSGSGTVALPPTVPLPRPDPRILASGSSSAGVSTAPVASGSAHLGGVSSAFAPSAVPLPQPRPTGGPYNSIDAGASPLGGPFNSIDAQAGNSGNSGNSLGSNSWSQLINSFSAAPAGSSSVAMNDPGGAKNTRVAKTIMVPVQTINPAYTEWMNNQSNINNPGISATGQALGAVGVNGVASGAISLGGAKPAVRAAPPKYITTQQQHTVYSTPPVAQPAYVPPPMTKIQQFQTANPTATPSQAYNSVGAQAINQAFNPNGAVYAAVQGNSGQGQIRGGAIA